MIDEPYLSLNDSQDSRLFKILFLQDSRAEGGVGTGAGQGQGEIQEGGQGDTAQDAATRDKV